MESMMKASPGKGKGRGKGGGRTKAEMRGAHNEGTIEMAPTHLASIAEVRNPPLPPPPPPPTPVR